MKKTDHPQVAEECARNEDSPASSFPCQIILQEVAESAESRCVNSASWNGSAGFQPVLPLPDADKVFGRASQSVKFPGLEGDTAVPLGRGARGVRHGWQDHTPFANITLL
jgi:hypothetical protein